MGAAIHREPLGQILDPIPQEAFDQSKWKINLKNFDQDIKKFDGEPSNYRMWWNRIKDHIMTSYQPWGRLLELVERQRVPLTFNFLKTHPRVDGADLDLVWLSKELWCFLGPKLGDSVYTSRIQKAGGRPERTRTVEKAIHGERRRR